MLHTIKILLMFSALMLLLSGCSERESNVPAQSATETRSEGQTVRDVVSSQGTRGTDSTATGGANATILPEFPTTVDNLHVVISGAKGKTTYSWQINSLPIVAATGSRLDSDLYSKGDNVTVTVDFDSQQVRAETTIINTPPEVVAVYALPPQVHRGLAVKVTPQGHDADGDTITYEYLWLINGEEQLFETSATLVGDRFNKGDRLSVIVTPSDGEDEGKAYTSGEIVVGNAAPNFVSVPPQNIDSSTYRYEVRAVDPDGDVLSYHLDAAPSGMVIDEQTGVITWEMTATHAGENTIQIIVSDTDGAEAVQEFSMNLTYAE